MNHREIIDLIDLPNPEEILSFIDKKCKEKTKWLDIGKVLKKYKNGLELWKAFVFEGESHEKYFEKFDTKNYLTVKTLAWYAQKDSGDKYKKWVETSWVGPRKVDLIQRSQLDIAKFIYRKYWLIFVCSNIERKTWYYFDGKRWIHSPRGIFLRQMITQETIPEIEKDIQEMMKGCEEETEDVKKMRRVLYSLKTNNFREGVIKLCMELFYCPFFEEIIDQNPYLFGVGNGVLEICEGQVCFRESKPEDYVTKFTHVKYLNNPLSEENYENYKKLADWLIKVFPDEEILDFFLKFSASCLVRRNSEKHFYIMTGAGDNSKSMIKKLFEETFGPYVHTFPASVLSNKALDRGPTPERSLAKNTSLCFIQEPDDDEWIKSGPLKEHTGGDSYFTRNLYDPGNVQKNTYKIVLFCNKPPSISNVDKAIRNRVVVIPFVSTWIDDPPESEEEQKRQRLFKKDPKFEEKIPELAPIFLSLIVLVYKRYHKEGLKIPPLIKNFTEKFWNENDPYSNFISEFVEEDKDSFIKVHDLCDQFRRWFRTSYTCAKVPDINVVKNSFIIRWGEPVDGKFMRKRLKKSFNVDLIDRII